MMESDTAVLHQLVKIYLSAATYERIYSSVDVAKRLEAIAFSVLSRMDIRRLKNGENLEHPFPLTPHTSPKRLEYFNNAMANGKTVQILLAHRWHDLSSSKLLFKFETYRIKPKKEYGT